MRPAKLLVVAVMALVLAASASVALARQVALVVGNSTYAHIGRLPNPENDAVDMAAALRRIGFEVTTELDADRVELTEALRAFTRRSAGADVSLVFYAGHGLEMDGTNYLVPVDARLERDVDVRYETVTRVRAVPPRPVRGRRPHRRGVRDQRLVPQQVLVELPEAPTAHAPARARPLHRPGERVVPAGVQDHQPQPRPHRRDQQVVERRRCWRTWTSRWRS